MRELSVEAKEDLPGFFSAKSPAKSNISLTFSLPVRLLAPHPLTGQDTLTISRGPIVYTAESIDNTGIDSAYPHFEGVGISSSSTFTEQREVIENIPVVMLKMQQPAYILNEVGTTQAFRAVSKDMPARSWRKLDEGLTFVPWFARANRGGDGRVRTAFIRADEV